MFFLLQNWSSKVLFQISTPCWMGPQLPWVHFSSAKLPNFSSYKWSRGIVLANAIKVGIFWDALGSQSCCENYQNRVVWPAVTFHCITLKAKGWSRGVSKIASLWVREGLVPGLSNWHMVAAVCLLVNLPACMSLYPHSSFSGEHQSYRFRCTQMIPF